MEDSLEVYFCDVCNASVPQPDLATGKAQRVKGRVLGACCLAEIRMPSAAVGATATPASQATPRTSAGIGIAGFGIVLLAAIAGLAVFVDWRLSDELGRLNHRVLSLEGVVQSQEQSLQLAVAGVAAGAASKGDLGGVENAVRGLAGQVAEGEARVRTAVEAADGRTAALSRSVAELRENQTQQLSGIQRLQRDLRALGEDVATLAALPRPAPVEPSGAVLEFPAAAVMPRFEEAGAGLSPELAHQVAKLDDADPGTRFEAVDKLIQSLDPTVVDHLVRMSRDADPFVRRLTVEGLADFRSPVSVDALLIALADPEGIVRHAAYGSLRKLTGQNIPFDPDGRKDDRRGAQRRWQEWWDKSRDTF